MEDHGVSRKALRKARRELQRVNECIKCSGPVRGKHLASVGAFVPDEPEQYVTTAPRANARRIMFYAVCRKCDPIDEIDMKAIENLFATRPYTGPVLDWRTRR